MVLIGGNIKNLEKQLEDSIKSAYSDGEYVRCYNLLKLLSKVNKNNYILHKYIVKLDNKNIEKIRNKWALGKNSFFRSFIISPRLYLLVGLFIIFGRIK